MPNFAGLKTYGRHKFRSITVEPEEKPWIHRNVFDSGSDSYSDDFDRLLKDLPAKNTEPKNTLGWRKKKPARQYGGRSKRQIGRVSSDSDFSNSFDTVKENRLATETTKETGSLIESLLPKKRQILPNRNPVVFSTNSNENVALRYHEHNWSDIENDSLKMSPDVYTNARSTTAILPSYASTPIGRLSARNTAKTSTPNQSRIDNDGRMIMVEESPITSIDDQYSSSMSLVTSENEQARRNLQLCSKMLASISKMTQSTTATKTYITDDESNVNVHPSTIAETHSVFAKSQSVLRPFRSPSISKTPTSRVSKRKKMASSPSNKNVGDDHVSMCLEKSLHNLSLDNSKTEPVDDEDDRMMIVTEEEEDREDVDISDDNAEEKEDNEAVDVSDDNTEIEDEDDSAISTSSVDKNTISSPESSHKKTSSSSTTVSVNKYVNSMSFKERTDRGATSSSEDVILSTISKEKSHLPSKPQVIEVDNISIDHPEGSKNNADVTPANSEDDPDDDNDEDSITDSDTRRESKEDVPMFAPHRSLFVSPMKRKDMTEHSLISDLSESFSSPHESSVGNFQEKVLRHCEQTEPMSFQKFISQYKKVEKLGEGTFAEVFRVEKASKETFALKIIPIEGDFPVNEEPQKMFQDILPEIAISLTLSGMSERKENRTPNFIHINKVLCVKGKYPKKLMTAWNKYDKEKTSENDNPSVFDENQLFIVFSSNDAGRDLEKYVFTNSSQAFSAFVQVCLTLAVAENAVCFEHRDLHQGNVLIATTPANDDDVTFVLKGQEMKMHGNGVFVTIIDFTLSRVKEGKCAVFNDLSQDPGLFIGKGDYQFEIYRLMQKHVKNQWNQFTPYTNVLWLHYLLDKLVNDKKYKGQRRTGRGHLLKLKKFYDTILSWNSASDFVLGNVDSFELIK